VITGMPRIAIAGRDLTVMVSTFKDKLGLPVVDLRELSTNTFGAGLAMCTPEGGSNIELMAPEDRATALSQSIQGFIDRRGEGHFALMLEAAVPDEEAVGLAARGLRVLPLMQGAAGRDIHPASTHGVLIRVYPTHSFSGPYPEPVSGPNTTGLTGIQRVIIAVNDIDKAADTYGRKIALDISEPVLDADRGVHAITCTPPTGGAIELVATNDPNKAFAAAIDHFVESRGEGLYALVLGTDDLQQTQTALATRGISSAPIPSMNAILEVDREATFGSRVWGVERE
jgi:hypothetical protein